MKKNLDVVGKVELLVDQNNPMIEAGYEIDLEKDYYLVKSEIHGLRIETIERIAEKDAEIRALLDIYKVFKEISQTAKEIGKVLLGEEEFEKYSGFEEKRLEMAEKGLLIDFHIVSKESVENLGLEIPENLPLYIGEIDDVDTWFGRNWKAHIYGPVEGANNNTPSLNGFVAYYRDIEELLGVEY